MRRLVLFATIVTAVLSAFACGSRTELLGELGGGLGNGNGNGNGQGGEGPDGAADPDGGLDASDDVFITLPDGARVKGDGVAPQVNPCGGYQAYAPWPAFQRCSAHIGRTEAVGPAKPVIRWSNPVGMTITGQAGVVSPPTIAADGTIYVANLYGQVVAFQQDGSQKWLAQPTFVETGPSAVAVGNDGTLYVELDQLYALRADGQPLWSANIVPGVGVVTLGPSTSSITLSQTGQLYLGTGKGLLSIDQSGSVIWTTSGLEQGWTPGIDTSSGVIYSGNLSGELIASQPNGTSSWTYTAPGAGLQGTWIQAAPVIAEDGTVYFGAVSGFYALSPAGKLKWQVPWTTTPEPGQGDSMAIGSDGTVFLASPDSTLRSISPKGKVLWSNPIGAPGSPPVIDGNGMIYLLAQPADAGATDQTLFAVTPAGKIAWSLPLPGVLGGALAVGADGTLYIATYPFDLLYAVGNAP